MSADSMPGVFHGPSENRIRDYLKAPALVGPDLKELGGCKVHNRSPF